MIALRRNVREELRIERQEYRGHDLINIRVWYDDGTGVYRPGKQGIAIRAEMLSEVFDALSFLSNKREAA